MRHKFITVMLLLGFTINSVCAQVSQKIGTSPFNKNSSAVLELESTDKGFLPPRLTTAERNAIASPATGLMIYNTSENCLEWYTGTAWHSSCGSAGFSGGGAVVSGYTCSTSSTGTMVAGIPVSGVTQTITAAVSTVGTYSISAVANGVTFAGSGTFSGTGLQNIVLTASGTPTSGGSNSFTLNTTPNCSFSRTTTSLSSSSNGTAVVSAYSCSTASVGTMTAGVAVSGVTQTITATVTTVGTYSISTTANGVTFSGSGTFAGTGAQNIVLTASGTPTSMGTNSFTLNTTPNCSFSRTTTANPSSNGTAVVSAYNCSTGSAGTMTAGVAVSGVTQIITATVTTVGTYSISTTSNGVTFSGSGTFAGTGARNIVLTATGTPVNVGTSSFTLNTTPNCSFSRTTAANPSSNGTAVVSAYSCSTASAGTMVAGIPVSGVTQTITATVTTVGTYSISTISNGVTFSGSGTFTGTGARNIVLTATGTPVDVETSSFVLNTSPSCSFTRSVNCGAKVTASTYKVFQCHNLGATTSLDPHVPVQGIHGNYYQWGRKTSVADASTASGTMVGWNTTAAANGSWLDGSKTANDPCPDGFRVPNKTQWDGVVANNTVSRTGTWTSSATNFTTAIHWGPNASTPTLTLPAAGYRGSTDGTLSNRGLIGRYWSSTEFGTDATYLYFSNNNAGTDSYLRTVGASVRCVSE